MKPWNTGVENCYSEETLQKMSDAHAGKHHSPETQFKKGQISPRKGKRANKPVWNKGKIMTLSDEQIRQINDLQNSGISLRKISKIINISRDVIRRELKKISE